jgi:DNA-binding transcriptional MerR regulator
MSDPAHQGPRSLGFGEAEADGSRLYTIGDLAGEFGLTTRAIRFYEAKGLLSPQRRGSARIYTRRDRARLMLILRGKNLGFSLEDVRHYLELYDADPTQTAQVRLLEAKIADQIAALETKRADLDRTLAELAAIREQIAAHLAGSEPSQGPDE